MLIPSQNDSKEVRIFSHDNDRVVVFYVFLRARYAIFLDVAEVFLCYHNNVFSAVEGFFLSVIIIIF